MPQMPVSMGAMNVMSRTYAGANTALTGPKFGLPASTARLLSAVYIGRSAASL